MISGAMNAGYQGIQSGLQGMQRSAEKLTMNSSTQISGGAEPVAAGSLDDITSSVLDLKLYEQVTAASVSVFKTADETIGTLLDTMA